MKSIFNKALALLLITAAFGPLVAAEQKHSAQERVAKAIEAGVAEFMQMLSASESARKSALCKMEAAENASKKKAANAQEQEEQACALARQAEEKEERAATQQAMLRQQAAQSASNNPLQIACQSCGQKHFARVEIVEINGTYRKALLCAICMLSFNEQK